MSLPDYYRTLGISPMATAGEIKHAYRDLAKRTHPDLVGLDPAKEAVPSRDHVSKELNILGKPHRDPSLSAY